SVRALFLVVVCSLFFFFFQAEDGIRDFHVTGVQTCALPIWRIARCLARVFNPIRAMRGWTRLCVDWPGRSGDIAGRGIGATEARSEERRVGKECRSRWWPYQ